MWLHYETWMKSSSSGQRKPVHCPWKSVVPELCVFQIVCALHIYLGTQRFQSRMARGKTKMYKFDELCVSSLVPHYFHCHSSSVFDWSSSILCTTSQTCYCSNMQLTTPGPTLKYLNNLIYVSKHSAEWNELTWGIVVPPKEVFSTTTTQFPTLMLLCSWCLCHNGQPKTYPQHSSCPFLSLQNCS